MLRAGCLALVACGGSPASPDAPIAIDAMPDVPMHVDDGTPMRHPCTNNFGSALTQTFGRLDGFLVAIVAPGGGGCNADPDHVHLQIQANGAVYDVAITVGSTGGVDDVCTTTRDQAMPGPAWAEGWHTGATILDDYVSDGVHSSALANEPRTQLASDLMTDLASANHISVFATGYGPDGVHLVHRNGGGHDGLVITQPLSTPAHLRMFRFTNQTF
jgi:hypothetical protein